MTVDLKVRSSQADGNPGSRDIVALNASNYAFNVNRPRPFDQHLGQLNRLLVMAGHSPIVDNDPRLVLDDYTQTGWCFIEDNDPFTWDDACDTWEMSDNRQFTGSVTWDISDTQNLKLTAGKHDVFNADSVEWVPFGAENRRQDYWADSTVLEAVLNSTLARGAVDLVTGVSYYGTDRSVLGYVVRNHDRDLRSQVRSLDGDRYQGGATGIFAQGVYHFPNDATNFTLGLRYTDENGDYHLREWESGSLDITYKDCTTASSTSSQVVRDPNCLWENTGSETWTETDYRVAIDHAVSEDAMIFASVSKAYNSGVFSHSPEGDIDPATYELTPTDPEIVVSTEVGLRSDWLDNRLRFNLTLFDMNFSNRQQNQLTILPNGTPVGFVVDVGDVDTKGWEIDLVAGISDGLSLNFSAGSTDATLGDAIPVNDQGVSTRAYLQYIPRYSYNLALRHSAQVGAGTLATNLNYTWQDEHYSHASEGTDQAYITPSQGSLNGRLAWRLESQGLTVALEGTNLTDESYGRHYGKWGGFFHGFNNPGVRNGPIGSQNWGLMTDRAPPRMIALSLTRDFGD